MTLSWLERFLVDLALALIPGVAWLVHFYRKDRYEPEPVRLVALAFLYGALLVPLAGYLEGILSTVTGAPAGAATGRLALTHVVLVVSPVEELLKALVLALRFYRDREFNEPMDGIIYGVSVGLGFATVENALYIMSEGPRVLLLRGVISTLLHAGCTGIAGYGLGRAKFAHHPWRPLARGMATAALMHALFDGAATLAPHLLGPRALVGVTATIALVMAALLFILDADVDEAERSSPFRPRHARRRHHRHHPPDPSTLPGDTPRGGAI